MSLDAVLIVAGLAAVAASALIVTLPMMRVRLRSGGLGLYPGDIRDMGLALSMVLVLVPTVIVASSGSTGEIVFSLFAVAFHGLLLNTFRVKTVTAATPGDATTPDTDKETLTA